MSKITIVQKIGLKLRNLFSPYERLNYFCSRLRIDLVFPLLGYKPSHRQMTTVVAHWIPDFQHRFLSYLFSEQELAERDANHRNIAANSNLLILSSEDAQGHFQKFYPNSHTTLLILRFKSIIRKNDILSRNAALNLIPEQPYFIVSNQFWSHKNHILVLEAIQRLKENGFEILVLFTGKFHDPRDPNYSEKLLLFVEENRLSDSVQFLGFIDRNLQLRLMLESLAIIQPSKFEGWSTVIEDAKALGVPVLASALDVNKEQLGADGHFFPTESSLELARHMQTILERPPQKGKIQSEQDRLDYAHDLLALFYRQIK